MSLSVIDFYGFKCASPLKISKSEIGGATDKNCEGSQQEGISLDKEYYKLTENA
jgi:hypothetical protein